MRVLALSEGKGTTLPTATGHPQGPTLTHPSTNVAELLYFFIEEGCGTAGKQEFRRAGSAETTLRAFANNPAKCIIAFASLPQDPL